MSTLIGNPYSIIQDGSGQPLDAGYVYIGQENLNPEAFHIQVYFDEDLTIPAPQPLRTINGYFSRNGTPAKIFIGTTFCSITIRKKDKSLVFSDLNYGGELTSEGKGYVLDYYKSGKVYPLNARIALTTGEIVVSTIPSNANDPNSDMTGWVLESSIGAIYNPLNAIFKPEQLNSTNFTSTLNNLMASISSAGGGTVEVHDGLFEVDAATGLTIPNDVHLVMGKGTTIKAKPFTVGSYELIRIHDVKNVSVTGGNIDGNRSQRLSSTGSYYKEWQPNTTYIVGDCIALQRMGAIVTTTGITGSTPPTITKEPSGLVSIGVGYTDGTCQYTSIQDIGEWGMGISIRGSTDVDINDININNCWGDAIYLGRTTSKAYSENVNFNNVVSDNNRRQGISVISVKNSTWNGIKLINTNGADPQAGVDFEPNYDDEVLENIVINGLTTSNNDGNGIHIYLGQWNSLTSPTDKVSITINGFEDVGSRYNIYMRSTNNVNVKGFIDINGARLLNPTSPSLNANVFLEACEGYAVQMNLNKPYFESDLAIPFVRLGYNSSNTTVGGLHIKGMNSKYTGTKYDNPILLTASTVEPANISVIDPIKIDSINPYTSIGSSNYNVSDVKIEDRYGACRLQFNASISHQNWWMYSEMIFDNTAAGFATYSIVSVKKGRKFKVSNKTTSQQLTIAINAAVTVVDYPPSVSGAILNFIVLSNEYVEFEAIAENVLRVVSKSDAVTDTSRVLTYSYAGASIPANSTTNVSVTFNGARSVDFFNAYFGNASDLILRAVCNTSGTVVLKISNPTTSPISAPAGNIFIKKV